MSHETDPGYSVIEGVVEAGAVAPAVDEIPEWFQQFLDHRQASKPSAHTMKAYRRDFVAIANLLTGGEPARLSPADITRDSMRAAFAAFAADHEAASIRRCWSTWNVLCTFLYTNELLAANPMQLVGRPKLKKPLPKALPEPLWKHCSLLSRRSPILAEQIGKKEISRSSSLHSSRDCGPKNCAWSMLATYERSTTAPQ